MYQPNAAIVESNEGVFDVENVAHFALRRYLLGESSAGLEKTELL